MPFFSLCFKFYKCAEKYLSARNGFDFSNFQRRAFLGGRGFAVAVWFFLGFFVNDDSGVFVGRDEIGVVCR